MATTATAITVKNIGVSRQGNVIVTMSDDKTACITREQLTTAQMIGLSLPKLGETVVPKPSVNPTTGQASDTWVNLW